MNTPLKITAFAAAVAATFGAAYGAGAIAPPMGASAAPAAHSGHDEADDAPHEDDGHGDGGHGEEEQSLPGGLQIAEGGYSLDLQTPRVSAGKKSELRFAIRDDKGRKVTAFKREHGKELHLIVAARDLNTYRHLHPTRAADGTWSIRAGLPAAGTYRMFTDFTPAADSAEGLTLGTDLAVVGSYRPAPLPKPAGTAKIDGYTVALQGQLRPGQASELTLKVSRNGRSVTDLDPYLGAYGHLVALRSGDLAYLHVHPNGTPGDGKTKPGPGISFTATAPSAGAYRLFLDFQHHGKVRTASFTVEAGRGDGQQPVEPSQPEKHEEGHQH